MNISSLCTKTHNEGRGQTDLTDGKLKKKTGPVKAFISTICFVLNLHENLVPLFPLFLVPLKLQEVAEIRMREKTSGKKKKKKETEQRMTLRKRIEDKDKKREKERRERRERAKKREKKRRMKEEAEQRRREERERRELERELREQREKESIVCREMMEEFEESFFSFFSKNFRSHERYGTGG